MSRYNTGRFGPDTTAGANSPTGKDEARPSVERKTLLTVARWQLLRRRTTYIARFVFWTVWHRSTSRARWVLAFEGVAW